MTGRAPDGAAAGDDAADPRRGGLPGRGPASAGAGHSAAATSAMAVTRRDDMRWLLRRTPGANASTRRRPAGRRVPMTTRTFFTLAARHPSQAAVTVKAG